MCKADAKFGYAYIFDYTVGGIYEYELTENTTELETEELLAKLGLSIDQCYVMFSEEKLSIEPIEIEE